MKIFAFYLPQFHAIPENDKWWGKGFTEWTNVKAAKPLYKGHEQPKHPLNNNYYNLLDKKVIEWQNSLLEYANIDGFIYYHYYFGNKKLLLEKPAENLLEWKDIPYHFFFCWANHPWIKSWEGKKELLMPINYGDRSDWEDHFQYLLKFFQDGRYEKVDNKPVFMLFKSDVFKKNEMMEYFNRRCQEEGFKGICMIESYHGDIPLTEFKSGISKRCDYIFFREPAVTKFYYEKEHVNLLRKAVRKIKRSVFKNPEVIDGNLLMKYKLANEVNGKQTAHGIWFEWDNTPRHKERGYVITRYSKEKFLKYFSLIKDDDFLFLNAWNEWAEGMILEPTKENGQEFLEWIKEAQDIL